MQELNTSILIYSIKQTLLMHDLTKLVDLLMSLYPLLSDCNKNFTRRCVYPKTTHFLRPNKIHDRSLDPQKYWGCQFSTPKICWTPPLPVMYTASTPLLNLPLHSGQYFLLFPIASFLGRKYDSFCFLFNCIFLNTFCSTFCSQKINFVLQ